MQKRKMIELAKEAVSNGARIKRACEELGISYKSFLRWNLQDIALNDHRKGATKKVHRKMSETEEEEFFKIANTEEYCDLTPEQIVADLAEKGDYMGSSRSLYRILKKRNAVQHRTESKAPSRNKKPSELTASGPNEVWSWDITWLKSAVAGIFFYAYVVIDIYSRKIVGWTIEKTESDSHARLLFERIMRDTKQYPKFVHSDNGAPMRGLSLVSFLTQMKVGLSYSRPRVSDDNPYIESFFKTLKYKVDYPKYFESSEHARMWIANFVHWYNHKHRHSGINYVTPEQRHIGQDKALLEARQATLHRAYEKHPERFVKGPSKIVHNEKVILNKAS